jgi:transglutaminase-like putative cysteine protease
MTTKSDAQSRHDFEVVTDYNISFNEYDNFVEIEEVLRISSNNRLYFLPAQGTRDFELPDFTFENSPSEREFKIDSLEVLDRFGNSQNYTVEQHSGGITVKVEELQAITYSSNYQITLRYKTHELVDNNGNVINLFIPGLPQDTPFEEIDSKYGISTSYTYNTQLEVPSNLERESYLRPSSIVVEEDQNTRTYSLDQVSRLGETSWIQLGTKQYYYFRIEQETRQTDQFTPKELSKYSDLLSRNIYKLPLPKEHPETKQEVYFTNITPKPTSIERDKEGNLTAYFEVPANDNSLIRIEGYIALDSSEGVNEISDIDLTRYKDLISQDQNLSYYTVPDLYWESDAPEIVSIAEEISEGKETLLELVRADYDYVIENFEYSYSKVENGNERLGALAAFRGAECVCMEYSDATIALLRAQGIPARAAVGYGNDPTGAENAIGNSEALAQRIGHQWLQVWVPGHGWMSVDPTWGETGRDYIGANLDHILWYTIGDSTQSFIGTSLSSADNVTSESLDAYEVYLQAVTEEEFPTPLSMQPLNNLLDEYQDIEYDNLSVFLKTNSLGRSIVIATPIAIAFLVTLAFFAIVVRVFKKKVA